MIPLPTRFSFPSFPRLEVIQWYFSFAKGRLRRAKTLYKVSMKERPLHYSPFPFPHENQVTPFFLFGLRDDRKILSPPVAERHKEVSAL